MAKDSELDGVKFDERITLRGVRQAITALPLVVVLTAEMLVDRIKMRGQKSSK